MTEFHQRVLVANAGSGKTFRLAHAYLSLLLAGVEPREILATTFTRKAAGEILGRVLGLLLEAAESEEALGRMLANLETRPDPAPTREDCAALADRLLRELHTFQVRTLDSWFVHLARLRGLELGLPPGWMPCEEGDVERQLARVSRDLVREDPDDLLEVLRDLRFGRVETGVLAAQDELFARGLHLWHQSEPPAWERMRPDPEDEGLELDPHAIAEAIEGLIASDEMPKTGQRPNGNWKNGLESLANHVREQNWKKVLTSSLITQLAAEVPQYYSKPIPTSWFPILRQALDIPRKEFRSRIHRANVASERLLAEAAPALDALRRREGRIAFEDLPRLLAGAEGEPYDALRLDGEVRHLLLDEFQDTSLLQWRAVEPLATRVVSSGGAFFAVGDPKQSIYGWRGGEPRLLGGLPERLRELTGKEPEREPMTRSWRSAPQLLAYVDRLGRRCAALAEDDAWKEGDRRALREMARLMADGHEAAKPDLQGGVRIRRAEDHRDYRAVADAVEDVVRTRDRVGGGGTVAVLVRDNKSIPHVLLELRNRGIQASGEGGNPLVDADAVNAALALLWLADHPGDGVSWIHVAASPLARVLPGFPGARPEGEGAERFATEVLRRLADEGYGGFLTTLLRTEAFPAEGAADDPGEPGVRWDAWNRARFVQLVELGHEWDRRGRLRPSEFVAFVERRRVEDPRAASVRVMTVHQAKGLEFDAVVFFAAQSTQGGNRGRGYVGLRGSAFEDYETVTVAPGSEESSMDAAGILDPAAQERWEREGLATFHETYHADRASRTLEELCVVYVAVTRAKHWLEVVVNPKPEKPSSFSRPVLFADDLPAEPAARPEGSEGAEGEEPPAAEPPRLLEGSADLEQALRCAGTAAKEEEPDGPPPTEEAPELRMRPARTAKVPRRVKPSSAIAEGGGLAFLEAGIGASGARARRRGTLVHALLERVEWLEDGVPDEAELRAALEAASPPAAEDEAEEALAALHAALECEPVRRALSRPEGVSPDRLELERERRFRTILDLDGEGALVEGAFDRVVVELDEDGTARSVRVLDFKTGPLPDEAARERARRHHAPQMELYRKAAARIWSVPEDAVTATLVFVDAGEAIMVPA